MKPRKRSLSSMFSDTHSLFDPMTEDDRQNKVKFICDFCNKLCAYWISHPDLRFGQIVFNIFMTGVREGLDIFFMEDKEALDLLETEYNN